MRMKDEFHFRRATEMDINCEFLIVIAVLLRAKVVHFCLCRHGNFARKVTSLPYGGKAREQKKTTVQQGVYLQ